MIFPDSDQVILANRGRDQVLLWASPGMYSSYTLFLSQILNSSQKDEGMMELVNIDALIFKWKILRRDYNKHS